MNQVVRSVLFLKTGFRDGTWPPWGKGKTGHNGIFRLFLWNPDRLVDFLQAKI
jgi:hypothetical protein